MIQYLLPALILLASPAAAQDCPSLATVMTSAAAHGGRVVVLDPRALTQAATLYNSLPPESDRTFSLGVLVDFPDGSGAVVFGRPDAMCDRLVNPPGNWRRIRQIILGQGA